MSEAEKAIGQWDKHAQNLMADFGAEGDQHRIVLLNPTLFGLIGDVADRTVLDAGCGDGYLSRLLAKQGAVVTGVDFSTAMLRIAHERTSPDLAITYHHGNCESLPFLEADHFDLIISNMVLQDLPNYQAAIEEAFRLIKPDGLYIVSISHPCFISPQSGWERNSQGWKQHWRVDRYFCEGRYEQEYPLDSSDKLFWYHRTLSSYVDTFIKSGFHLEAMQEPQPSSEMLDQYPGFKDELRMCNFIVFRLRQPG